MATKDFQPVINFDLEVVIADGQTTSNAVDLLGTTLGSFTTDSSLDGTSFTFLASNELAGTYLPLKNMKDDNSLTAVVSPSGWYVTNPADFAYVRFLKIVSGTAQSGAATTIKLVNRRLA